MTISIKPTSSGSTIEQDGGTILSVDSSGNLTFPNNATFSGTVTGVSSYSDSDALTLLNASGSAPVFAARAWINFNGQGTVAIRTSGNVSSLTDNGTGLYRVNFTTAMPDTDYTISGAGQYDTNGNANTPIIGLPRTTTSQGTGYVDISTAVPNSSNYDCLKVLVIVHR